MSAGSVIGLFEDWLHWHADANTREMVDAFEPLEDYLAALRSKTVVFDNELGPARDGIRLMMSTPPRKPERGDALKEWRRLRLSQRHAELSKRTHELFARKAR